MNRSKQLVQLAKNYGKHLPAAVVANVKYGFPGKKIKVIGVTGTDGKTTTVNMIYSVLKDAGKKVSMISTINATIAGKAYETGFHVTSPAAADIQRFLKMAVDHGDEYMVLEITSHALDQFRAWGIPLKIAVITNITHEHLDYHQTFDRYLQAKARLITHAGQVVLNRDDGNFSRLSKMTSGEVKSVSLKQPADLNLVKFPLKLRLAGDYNISNALQVAMVAKLVGIDEKSIKKSLESFEQLSGRMEEVRDPHGLLKRRGIRVVVDFAHTPNALEQALSTLKAQTRGNLIAVFGAASQRDVEKRPMMGQMAARYADITILTAEDPRFEDPPAIIDQIARGAIALGAKENQTLFRQVDRQKAIDQAIGLAKPGDIVGIFGKGHEKTMNIKGVEKPWSDQQAVIKAVSDGK